MDFLSGVAGGVAGAIVTAGLAYLAVMRSAKLQDKRNLRDARSARTRESLGFLLATAMQIRLVADEPMLTDAPMREQLLKFREELAAMWPQMLKTRSQVLSEPDGLKWVTDFDEQILSPFREYQNTVRQETDGRKELAALLAGIATFQAAVAAHFAQLDKPI